MPKKGEHTPISDDEAMAMALRMAKMSPEMMTEERYGEWSRFVQDKMYERGYRVTEAQIANAWKGADYLRRYTPLTGFTTTRRYIKPGVYEVAYRDTRTGAFISRETAAGRASFLGYAKLADAIFRKF